MATPLVLNQWEDKFLPGSASDAQLFHADASDHILVCSPHVGQGYIQKVLLAEDLSLIIQDVTNQAVAMEVLERSKHVRFEFQIEGAHAGHAWFVPSFGLNDFVVAPARKRLFEIEIIFQKPALIEYLQAFIERLSPQTYGDANSVLKSIYRHQGGGSIKTMAGMFNQVFRGEGSSGSDEGFEHVLDDDSYSALVSLTQSTRHLLTPVMEQVIGQILSCPYQGAIRRAYLKRKALELVSLYLEAMLQPPICKFDFHCIYQAAAILRNQLANPPTVKALVRQVGTNRLYLNQGFHQVYGTTPYGYLRDCRLWQARRLLLTSELSVGKVATAVGYTCRGHFATAFRQQIGVNPKSFQMAAWQHAG